MDVRYPQTAVRLPLRPIGMNPYTSVQTALGLQTAMTTPMWRVGVLCFLEFLGTASPSPQPSPAGKGSWKGGQKGTGFPRATDGARYVRCAALAAPELL